MLITPLAPGGLGVQRASLHVRHAGGPLLTLGLHRGQRRQNCDLCACPDPAGSILRPEHVLLSYRSGAVFTNDLTQT